MAYRNGNGSNGGYGNNYYGNNGGNNGGNNRNKLDLTKTAFYRPANGDISSAFGMVEGFIQEIQIRTVTGNNGHPMRVANVKLSAIMDDARVASLFGDAFVNPQFHSVLFRISYWDSMVDTLVNLNPRKGQKGIALIRNMRPEINTGRNGNLYKVVDASGCGMLFLTSKSRKQESAIVFADNQNGGQGYGQGYGQNGGQGYNQNGGQGYGQNGGQGYNQNGGQGYNQNGGQGYNQGYGQGYNQGYGQGNSQNGGQGNNQGYGQGYNQGYGQGNSRNGGQGNNQGYGQGNSQNGGQGYNQGYGQGNSQNGSQGYNQGYGQGNSQNTNRSGNQGNYQNGPDSNGFMLIPDDEDGQLPF